MRPKAGWAIDSVAIRARGIIVWVKSNYLVKNNEKKTTFAGKTRFSRHCFGFQSQRFSLLGGYCWFSHDVTKIQTTKLSILLRFYFRDVLEQLKTNFQTNFPFKRVLGFVIKYAWISKPLLDAAFSWRSRELSFRLKKWLFSKNFVI